LKPDPKTRLKGRGHFREFPAAAPLYGERTWALLASALKKVHLPFADIKDFIDFFRAFLTFAEEPQCGWRKVMETNPVGRALLGNHEVVTIFMDDLGKIGWSKLVSVSSIEELKQVKKFETVKGDQRIEGEDWGDASVEVPVNVLAKSWSINVNLSAALAPLLRS
jgi:hypothetical protein